MTASVSIKFICDKESILSSALKVWNSKRNDGASHICILSGILSFFLNVACNFFYLQSAICLKKFYTSFFLQQDLE
jgi:hypothetical protein